MRALGGRGHIASFEEIAVAIMHGVTSEPPWQEFVCLLRDRFGGNHANIIFRRPDLPAPFMTHDFAPEVLAAGDPYTLYRPDDDPIPYYRMEPGRAYSIDEFVGEGKCEAACGPEGFVGGFLHRLGMASLLITRITTETGLQAWISVTHARANAFGAGERADLEQIGRLFAPTLALFGNWKEAIDQRDAYARVVRAKATGIVRIDQNGKVIDLDPATAAWIGEEPALRIDNGRLRATAAADRKRLEEALASIIQGGSEEELLAIDRGDGRTIELLIFRVSEPYETAWAAATRAIIYLRVDGRETLPSPQRIRTLFGLTQREAALAILLTRGLTLTQAAQNLHISDMTARAYLRQIFRKTGVVRQAELIRQLQASIASVN